MPHTVALLAAASEEQGLGGTFRVVLIAALVGAALLAWLLLRGYRGNGDDGDNN